MTRVDDTQPGAIWSLSAGEIAAQVRSGGLRAIDVVNEHLLRIDDVNPVVNALTVVYHSQARARASDIDRRRERGEDLGALAGVPITIKENIDLTWSATTDGWTFRADAIPERDATVVERLLAADAIPIGRGNMPPKGLRWDTDNELFGRTYNPWDRSRVPGGSSGGDAVAVATGMAPLALGNDYGGSLRLPAYAAGACALRPSAGRVPLGAPVDEPMPLTELFFAVNGPIARTVDDLDAAFALMHGADGVDAQALTIPHPDHYDGPRRVAVVRDPLGWGVDDEVAAGIDLAARALAAAGWELTEVEPPMLEDAARLWRALSSTELRGMFEPGVLPAPFDADATAYFVANSSEVDVFETRSAYSAGWARRHIVASAWESFQTQYPVVLGPVSARRVPKIGYDLSGGPATTELWRSHRLLVAVNFLGLPSVAVPTNVAEDGMPAGVQLIGPRNGDHIALAAAKDVFAALGKLTPIDPRT